MYQERLKSLEMENVQVNQRLQEANRAVDLADVHLRKEIEKIQLSLEQEYSRRYDREHKQHKHELDKLRQQLTNKPSPGRVTSSVNVQQETEEIKKICRAEIDRLYRK